MHMIGGLLSGLPGSRPRKLSAGAVQVRQQRRGRKCKRSLRGAPAPPSRICFAEVSRRSASGWRRRAAASVRLDVGQRTASNVPRPADARLAAAGGPSGRPGKLFAEFEFKQPGQIGQPDHQ